jgi:hypothetical protein
MIKVLVVAGSWCSFNMYRKMEKNLKHISPQCESYELKIGSQNKN